MKKYFKNQKGFTLIELLVVIAIIGLLATIVEANLSASRAKARDAYRQSALHELRNALELYHTDHNAYPEAIDTYSQFDTSRWFSSEPGDAAPNGPGNPPNGVWIPELVPTYIPSLPRDPRGGLSKNPSCLSSPTAGWQSAFLYVSNGKNYKLVSHCAPEGTISPNDALTDPTRDTWSWMVTNKNTMPPSGNCNSIKWLFGTDYPICW